MPAISAPHSAAPSLFHSRFTSLASNTIDYWLLPEDHSMTVERLTRAIERAPVTASSSLQLYVHVPFCAQRCRFCAFSGGNSLQFDAAGRYTRLLIEQMRDALGRLPARDRPIRSVHIGGGSPDLLGPHLATLLRAVRDLAGFSADTELAVECTPTTTTAEVVEVLVEHEVTKLSFGVQSLDAGVRRAMRQPPALHHVDRLLQRVRGRIPIVNADLMTGLPSQDLAVVNRDLRGLLEEPRIHAISSYLLTTAAAPALVAAIDLNSIAAPASAAIQAAMRLHTYSTFQRYGWLRRGTNTYLDPTRIAPDALDRVSGNECIGTKDHDDFLLGIGAQAVSSLPGARIENLVDIESWCDAVERGVPPWFLPKCSTAQQPDMALWVMPLRWEGLPRERFDRMLAAGALTDLQLRTLNEFQREGLVVESQTGFELSILGEVFMGHLVRELKTPSARAAVDAYAAEGRALGAAIAHGELADRNAANDRQRATAHLRHDGTS